MVSQPSIAEEGGPAIIPLGLDEDAGRPQRPEIDVVVSLERGTCSDRATARLCEYAFVAPPRRLFAPNFAEAARLARDAENAMLLTPHLHAICGELSTSAAWRSIDSLTFALPNPPLYLARRRLAVEGAISALRRCATIPALGPLIADDDPSASGIDGLLEVDTTQAAARACADGRAEFCVTNQSGVEALGLVPVRRLKQITVCWIAFHPIVRGATYE